MHLELLVNSVSNACQGCLRYLIFTTIRQVPRVTFLSGTLLGGCRHRYIPESQCRGRNKYFHRYPMQVRLHRTREYARMDIKWITLSFGIHFVECPKRLWYQVFLTDLLPDMVEAGVIMGYDLNTLDKIDIIFWRFLRATWKKYFLKHNIPSISRRGLSR